MTLLLEIWGGNNVLEVRWNVRSTTYFLTRGPRSPGYILVTHAATTLALCKQVSVLPSFVHSMSLNIERFWIVPVQLMPHIPLMSMVEAPGSE